MTRLLRKLLFGPIPVVSSPRVQLYGALFLFGWGLLVTLHAPQGFWDYIIRCATCLMALFLCLHAGISRGGLSFLERILCSVLLALLLVLTPAFLWEAFHVRVFCDR